MKKYSKSSPDLADFRKLVRNLMLAGLPPTPDMVASVADGKYAKGYAGGKEASGGSFRSGKYTQARRDVMLLGGWRMVMKGKNFSWKPLHRAPDTSEGHPVVSQFRRGDVVRIMVADIRETNNVRDDEYTIVGYEDGRMLDRNDLRVPGLTALCIQVEANKKGESATILCADDELALVKPSPDFPLL